MAGQVVGSQGRVGTIYNPIVSQNGYLTNK